MDFIKILAWSLTLFFWFQQPIPDNITESLSLHQQFLTTYPFTINKLNYLFIWNLSQKRWDFFQLFNNILHLPQINLNRLCKLLVDLRIVVYHLLKILFLFAKIQNTFFNNLWKFRQLLHKTYSEIDFSRNDQKFFTFSKPCLWKIEPQF